MFSGHKCKIASIWCYPVKSLAGEKLHSAELIDTGIRWDRNLMLVNNRGKFITQREHPVLSQISAKIIENRLLLSYSSDQIQFKLKNTGFANTEITIWKSTMKARKTSDEASRWFSDILQQDVKLVGIDKVGDRTKLVQELDVEFPLAFTDGYPIHIVNQASLDDLGIRLGCKLDILRFRPNFLISGLPAYSEDNIDKIWTENFELQVVKPAARCVIPNINPELGSIDINVLRELSSYRMKMNKTEFGIYAYVNKKGKAFRNEDLSITYR